MRLIPDTNGDNYESNYITTSVGMIDKQVVLVYGILPHKKIPQVEMFLRCHSESSSSELIKQHCMLTVHPLYVWQKGS